MLLLKRCLSLMHGCSPFCWSDAHSKAQFANLTWASLQCLLLLPPSSECNLFYTLTPFRDHRIPQRDGAHDDRLS